MAIPCYELRQLRPEDIDQLVAIEKLSFATPWSREAFLGESAAKYHGPIFRLMAWRAADRLRGHVADPG